MAIRYYDEALVNKIQRWIKDPNIQILKPDEASRFFEVTLDETKDRPLHLPLISITRDRNIEITNMQKQPRTFMGFNQADPSKPLNIPANVIPININYQIDIYTKGMVEADEYIRNFVFNFINYPRLEIDIPYQNLNISHVADIHLDSNISDNSDIKEHLFADEFVRFTLKLNIEGAYLFSLPSLQAATWADVTIYKNGEYSRNADGEDIAFGELNIIDRSLNDKFHASEPGSEEYKKLEQERIVEKDKIIIK